MAVPSTLFLIAGAALMGYLVVRRSPATTSAPGPAPYQGGGGGSGTQHVGAPGYVWPHPDKFPTQASFQGWLSQRGYQPGSSGNVRDGATVAAVHSYQRDFNEVRSWLIAQGWGAIVPRLMVDGMIGNGTIGAMVATDQSILPGNNTQDWQALVAQAKQQ